TRKKGGEIFIFGTNQKKLGSNVTEVIRNSGVEFYDTYDECLAQAKEKNVVRIHKDTSGHKIVMTKELIQNISLFAKSTVSTINVFSGKRAESKLVRKSAESMLKKDFYTFGMLSFDGDLCGTIFFFGYEKLLKEIAKVMLEDSNPDKQTAVDLTSEIMNTIGGKVKTAISKLNIPISISLPKSFGDKNQVAAIIENREGVSVNLKIEDNEFYLFIIGENLQEAL
ncbi:MAG: chemotaxis protein CheX, partial [Campylobacterales bacterium]|nr:chemotaxis protein CheX [Campylobacterales bacterium]